MCIRTKLGQDKMVDTMAASITKVRALNANGSRKLLISLASTSQPLATEHRDGLVCRDARDRCHKGRLPPIAETYELEEAKTHETPLAYAAKNKEPAKEAPPGILMWESTGSSWRSATRHCDAWIPREAVAGTLPGTGVEKFLEKQPDDATQGGDRQISEKLPGLALPRVEIGRSLKSYQGWHYPGLYLLKKVNGTPAHPDEQEMPASVHRIIKLKQMTKERLKKRKTNKLQVVERKKPIVYGMTRPEKPAPVFTQFPGESDQSFLWRVDHACKVFFCRLCLYRLLEDLLIQTVYEEVIAEAKFEKKFGVDVKRDIYTGAVIGVTKKPKDELSKIMMEGNTGKKKRELKPKNILSQVNKHKRSKLKLSKKNDLKEDRFSSYQDEVKFGEVVHGPPDLTAPRKANKETNGSRHRCSAVERGICPSRLTHSEPPQDASLLVAPGNVLLSCYSGGTNSSRRGSVNSWWFFPRYPMRFGSPTDTGLVGQSIEGTPVVGEESLVTKLLFPTVDAQSSVAFAFFGGSHLLKSPRLS
uniref:Uncharacterized protein n=1 Tax=Timema tahoe TaxID=61484 RepID=A0A7R9FND8_9NEOP|nr:unnamed protein product [Timema tahoe]